MRVLGVRRVGLCVALLSVTTGIAAVAADPPASREEPGPRFVLVSQNDRGRVADEDSVSPSLSGDGRWVAFTSYALNLDPRVRAGRNKQIYLWDRRTRQVRPALRRPQGGLVRDAEVPSLSPSGRFLSFCSRDPKLVRPDDYDPDAGLFYRDQDVFVADLRTGEIRRASSDRQGGASDGYSCTPQVADTGDVVFSSFATDLVRGDDNEVADTFLWDWSSGRLRRLTRFDAGNYAYDISADGSPVALVTTERLVGRDTNATGDLYAYERRGSVGGTWVLALTRPDGSPPLSGVPYGGISLSRTGRFVTAQSADGGLATPAVADKTLHLWLRDRRSGRTTLLNRTSSEFSEVAEVHVAGDGRTVTYLGSGTHDYGGVRPEGTSTVELFAWRRGHGVTSLTPGPDAFAATSGSDLSLDGDWATFTMVRDDVPGLNPLDEPARVVVYQTRVR